MVVPDNTKVFTADAKSMYTNIDTTTGIALEREFLNTNADSIPPDFPSYLFLEILETVMRNNIFSFSDTFWLQLSGTAMGTPVTCSYATITYGQYINITILPYFQDNLLYYHRYIDDILGIWLPPTKNPRHIWNEFKLKLNSWGKLEWQIEEPSSITTFLDLNVTIQDSSITFSTFQKPLNLYLYLPPLSAHPHSCLKGLIKGELNRYWLQSSPENFQNLVANFIKRLTARGHSVEHLTPLLLQAATTLDTTVNTKARQNDEDTTFFIHWRHHPKGLQRYDNRALYNTILQPHLDFTNTTLAIPRPKNLKDILTRAALSTTDGFSIQDKIKDLTKATTPTSYQY